MTESTETKQRMLHWTCRKCGGKWSAPLGEPISQDHYVRHIDDAHQKSICDTCLDKMALMVRKC